MFCGNPSKLTTFGSVYLAGGVEYLVDEMSIAQMDVCTVVGWRWGIWRGRNVFKCRGQGRERVEGGGKLESCEARCRLVTYWQQQQA